MSRLDKIREWQAEMGSDACAQCDYLLALTDKLLQRLQILVTACYPQDRVLRSPDLQDVLEARAAIEEARK